MKRIFDFILSLIALFVLGSFMILIAVLIKTTSKGPVFFKQRRMGKDNKEFFILKYRTMRTDTPNVATHLLSNPDRYITEVGKVLRKTSLDELSQLLNILKGEMSIVGPRPALYNQDDLTEARTKVGVHKLVPGLTGWAQINGRDEIPNEEKVRLDEEYLHRKSLIFDMKIIFMTVVKVFKSEGIVEGGTADKNFAS